MIAAAFCLAMGIYYEARGEPAVGQMAVADVIMHKAHWKQGNVCNAVFSRGYLTSLQIVRAVPKGNDKAWKRANKIAHIVMKGGRNADVTQGANHFYKIGTHPSWEAYCTKVVDINNHRFCRSIYD